jgi:putative membrane protein
MHARITKPVLTALLCAPGGAVAYVGGGLEPWHRWTITPAIVIATLLVLILYARGAAKSAWGQRAAFAIGAGLLFLALQSPLDSLAESSFAAHQVQHLVLFALAPMLLALSAPASSLISGMPLKLRRNLYAPVSSLRPVRVAFAVLAQPPVAALHLTAAMVFWLVPVVQAEALANPGLHDVMHFSMLMAGLFFWFSAFDPRPPPIGARYGRRIVAIVVVLVVNVLLGSYLSFKDTRLYPAYDELSSLGLPALADERLGGLIQYVPGSMMLVLGVILVLRGWSHREWRLEDWRARGFHQVRSHDLARRPSTRRVGLTLGVFSILMFTAAIVVVVIAHSGRL